MPGSLWGSGLGPPGAPAPRVPFVHSLTPQRMPDTDSEILSMETQNRKLGVFTKASRDR